MSIKRETITVLNGQMKIGDIAFIRNASCVRGHPLLSMLIYIDRHESPWFYSLCVAKTKFDIAKVDQDFIIRAYKKARRNKKVLIKCGDAVMIPRIFPLSYNIIATEVQNSGVSIMDMRNWPSEALVAWAAKRLLIPENQMVRYHETIDSADNAKITNVITNLRKGETGLRKLKSKKKKIRTSLESQIRQVDDRPFEQADEHSSEYLLGKRIILTAEIVGADGCLVYVLESSLHDRLEIMIRTNHQGENTYKLLRYTSRMRATPRILHQEIIEAVTEYLGNSMIWALSPNISL